RQVRRDPDRDPRAEPGANIGCLVFAGGMPAKIAIEAAGSRQRHEELLLARFQLQGAAGQLTTRRKNARGLRRHCQPASQKWLQGEVGVEEAVEIERVMRSLLQDFRNAAELARIRRQIEDARLADLAPVAITATETWIGLRVAGVATRSEERRV